MIDDELTDALRRHFVTPNGEVVEEAIEVANHFLGIFYIWDDIVTKVDDKLTYWIDYIVVGALTGEARLDKDFPEQRRQVVNELSDKLDQESVERFDKALDFIVYGTLRNTNQFYQDHEVLILSTVVDDAMQNYSKHIYESAKQDDIVDACKKCQWRFLYKIALICGGAAKGLELNTKLLAIE